jgi:nucleoside-diphosphate-sugar epimerase
MKILVTGGAGRLGYHVIDKLLEKGHHVRAFDLPEVNWSHLQDFEVEVQKGDITNPSTVKDACEDVEAVIHLAAILPPISEVNVQLTNKVNFHGTKNIILNIKDGHIIFSSSISVYGVTVFEKFPITETHPLQTHNNYSTSKIKAETQVKESGNVYNILRIAPISVLDLVEIPDIIPYMSNQRVEFIYVEDAALALVNTIEKATPGEIYNIAGGDTWQMTGTDYIERFYRALGVEVEPFFSDTYTAVDWYDTNRSKKLGYQRTSFNKFEEKLKLLGEEMGLR